MSYDVTDIAELARHHLVFGAPDDETANANLARRVSELQAMATAPDGHHIRTSHADQGLWYPSTKGLVEGGL